MMEDPQPPSTTTSTTSLTILCCLCGTPIQPNPSNTCALCLSSQSDISRGISTESTLHQCRGCQRWHKDSGKWIACDLESRDLMSICLSNISGLKSRRSEKMRLVDAGWIWTEPHSMRLKVRLTVQKEVRTGTILQQSFVVTFIVRNEQCIDCQAEFRQGSWKSLVQVRQHVNHKRTFLYLEQLILKHGAHRGCLSIETFRDGMDFYFPDKAKAARFISFLESVVPTRHKTSKKLISTDDKSNVANFKHTNLVELPPICKDDLLFLPAKMANSLGNISRLVLIKNISNLIHVIDPLTGQTASMSPETYWRNPIRPIVTANRARFSRYVVWGKEAVLLRKNVSKRTPSRKNKIKLARITMAKEADLGVNDVQYEENSHIGYLLKSGDVCVGYDLKELQLVEDEVEEMRQKGKLPDVVLVRKLYGCGDGGHEKKRIWKLERLDVDLKEEMKKKEIEMEDVDEEEFMREVEADKEYRSQMNVYKSDLVKKKTAEDNEDGEDEDEEDDQKLKLDELLDNLALNDGPDVQNTTMKELSEDVFQEYCEEGDRAAMDGISYVGKERARNIQQKDAVTSVGSTFGKEFMDKKFNFM